MQTYKTSASQISLGDTLDAVNNTEVENCSGCGRPLYYYGKVSDGMSPSWHRQPYAKNSYLYQFCNNCCENHLKEGLHERI